MYKIIVRSKKGTGDAIFYDPKISRMNWFNWSAPISLEKKLNITTTEEVEDFIESLKTERKIESLPKYNILKEECHHCPVVHFCKGIKPNENWNQMCNESYTKNTINLYWTIFALTGMKLESIEGDIRRPEQ